MAHSFRELSPHETQSLPIDRLGFLVLKHLVDTKEWNADNFLTSGLNLNLPEADPHMKEKALGKTSRCPVNDRTYFGTKWQESPSLTPYSSSRSWLTWR